MCIRDSRYNVTLRGCCTAQQPLFAFRNYFFTGGGVAWNGICCKNLRFASCKKGLLRGAAAPEGYVIACLLYTSFNAEKGTHLVTVAGIHVEPMGVYGGKQDSLAPIEG